ncbi:zinc-dependent metalloprotease [Ornithinimicrobium pekingense]|uniref:Hydrolase n=1 Tax=Ornithinimicrobium pekingense TaxID=384677 RepID=A0ABQ2F8Z1_9MICO|nr:zinc-dependent metalloprotease [Ornithinimicrobium pekingense]GGK65470.1 hydrolase [Ornithinimicrobium pekingense]
MSDHPPAQRPDDEPDPLEALFGGAVPPQMREALESMGLGSMDPAQLQQMRAQMEMLLGGGGGADEGPVNSELAHDVARQVVSQAGDASIGTGTRHDVEQVVQVASLWLDQVTDFPRPDGPARALSRAEWVEATLPVWQRLTAPVAQGLQAAMNAAMQQQLGQLGAEGAPQIPGLPPGMNPAALMGQMEPMVRRMSASMFGGQVGQAVGTLAGETLSGTEVGIPLVGDESVAMLPANVAAFAEGLEVDAGEVHLYLAVREAARVRLFAAVPWLGPQLLTAVEEYARDIRINTEGIEEAVRSADPQDPEAMQAALGEGLFAVEPSPAQQAALTRLETLLALVEGWVDVVTARATEPHLPHADALAEAVRRRRATGGPAEKTFASLVGLELRPRRMRDAANLWSSLEAAGGQSGRDEAWGHPDLAPTATDLDDPLGYADRRTAQDADLSISDEDIERLLSQGDAGQGEAGPDEAPGGGTDDRDDDGRS